MNTRELAAFLATEEGLMVARALLGLGTTGGAEGGTGREGPQPILEWRPVAGSGTVFERADALRCKPRRIEPKKEGVLRVCLFGESMAAGFPLAPAFTPALVLEDLLRRALAGVREVEVIDLSLPNMGPTEQLRVCEAARQFAPDLFVLMTGNNWYYGLSAEPTASPDARVRYARRLAEGGPGGLAETFRQQLRDRAKVMVKHLVAAAHDVGAAAVVAIPPMNHAWERRYPPPWLGGGRTAAWFERLDAARRALAAGDLDGTLAAADEMAAWEAGLTGTPQRLRSRALWEAGKVVEARDAAVQAIDACNWHNYSYALPQVTDAVAEVMRQGATERGYAVVDLERVLAEHTGSPFLDFRVFYDHCHLSVEGIQVAMAAVAAQVASPLLGAELSWRELAQQAPSPPSIVAASASFQAAHWASQFYPALTDSDLATTLRTQLRAAVDADEVLLDVMRDQVRLKSAVCPPGLNGALPRAARVPGVGAALLSHRLNGPFLTALIDVLRERGDPEIEAVLDELIRGYDERLREGLDLAHPSFGEHFWERTPLAWNDPNERQGAPFYRAPWPESRFTLLCGATQDLAVALVARSASGGVARLRVNGTPIGEVVLGPRWSTWRGTFPSAVLRRGINRVTIDWPALAVDDGQAIANAQRRLEMGAEADLFPVFGEVYALRVSA